jgi:hypothetical protein
MSLTSCIARKTFDPSTQYYDEFVLLQCHVRRRIRKLFDLSALSQILVQLWEMMR